MFPFHPTKLDRVHAEALASTVSTAPFSLWLAASFDGPARPAPVGARDPKDALEGGHQATLRANKGFSYHGGRGTPRDLTPR
jgi:hypothetical protein